MDVCFTMTSALSDDTSRQATALKILVEVLTNTKKIIDALSHIYEEHEVSIISSTNLQCHILFCSPPMT